MTTTYTQAGFPANQLSVSRRHLFARSACNLGTVALASLFNPPAHAAGALPRGALPKPHHTPRAKRIIYLFQSGGPSQLETLDYKPELQKHQGEELPDSVRRGQRVTLMTASQASFPCVGSKFRFHQHGQSGRWVSELLPHLGTVVDHIAVIKSVQTEAINHDPAITLINTGSQQLGHASLGSWLSYGIGCETMDLPAYVVLMSNGTGRPNGQPLFSRLWGSAYLPSKHQGVRFRDQGDPILYLQDPPGITTNARRRYLDALSALNRQRLVAFGDPEIETRIAQYELAFRMQRSIPELMDMSDETTETFSLYGEASKSPGTFASNCLLARRMAERGVRFIQLFHRGWDQHGELPAKLPLQCQDIDRASTALLLDLKRRGMLDETLVVWGGEFGRTVYCQGKLTAESYGRDHHGRCFSIWMAGGGVRPGIEYGKTDDYGYNIDRDPVPIHDLNATLLHCMGIDHERLTYRFRGLDHRLTGTEGASVIHDLLV